MQYIVNGLKLGKGGRFVHPKTGELIWDGINRPVVLDREADQRAARFFLANIRKTVGRTWKLWIEEVP